MKNKKQTIPIPIIIIILIIFLITILTYYLYITYNLNTQKLITLIQSSGIFAPLIYIIFMAIAIVISPIPTAPLAVIAGIVFGTVLGIIYTVIGAEVGAVAAFIIARKFARDYILKRYKNYIQILEKYPENRLAFFIFASRLLPVFQFDIISYCSGITKIKLYKFAIATFFGMLPVTILLVYYGASFQINSSLSLIFTIVILILMILIPKYLHKKYNKYSN